MLALTEPSGRAEYEAVLAECDARIAALEGEIAEAAKIAENANTLCKEMDELCRQGNEKQIGFELQMAGAAARRRRAQAESFSLEAASIKYYFYPILRTRVLFMIQLI